MNTLKSTLALAIALAAGVAANAQADTTTFDVKITITESCTISDTAATDVEFGTHASSAAANIDAQGTLVVNCTPNTDYDIALDNGQHYDTDRRMEGQGYFVPYALYRDASRDQAWGATIGTDTLAGTGTGANQSIPVYGRVAAGATNVPAGNYSDTVTATVTF